MFQEADVQPDGLLSGYLHDARCTWDHDSFDREAQVLAISVLRPRHEAPQRGRVLGFVPITRFQEVPATLTVRRVRDVTWNPPKHRSGRTYPLSFVELANSTFHIALEGADIVAELEGWAPVELRDSGPPTAEPTIHHVCKETVFDRLADELQRRRSDA